MRSYCLWLLITGALPEIGFADVFFVLRTSPYDGRLASRSCEHLSVSRVVLSFYFLCISLTWNNLKLARTEETDSHVNVHFFPL